MSDKNILAVPAGSDTAENQKAEDIEYQLLTESNLYVNEKVAEKLGITVPDSMNDRAVETFSEISEG